MRCAPPRGIWASAQQRDKTSLNRPLLSFLPYTMSYQDPYYSQNNRHYDNQQPYSDYNPYSNTQQHPTYDQSGYRDDEGYPSTNTHQANNKPLGQNREKGKYEEMFPPVFRPPEYVLSLFIFGLGNWGILPLTTDQQVPSEYGVKTKGELYGQR